jgi:F0F1-type ATP synthase membrane subunit b/b'
MDLKRRGADVRVNWQTIVVLSALIVPRISAASEGGSVMGSLFFPIINFALFFGVLVYAYRKSIAGALRARQSSTERHLARAREELESASEEYFGCVEKLRGFEAEKVKIFEEVRHEGEEMARLLIAHAEADAKRIVEESVRRRESERKAVAADFRLEVIRRAMSEIRNKLSQKLSAEEDRRLRREVLELLS